MKEKHKDKPKKQKRGKEFRVFVQECDIIPESAKDHAEHAEMVYYFCHTPYLAGVVQDDD